MRACERIDRCWPDYLSTLTATPGEALLAHDANFPIDLMARPVGW